MSKMKILNQSEKREIEQKLQERFGIKKIPGILVKFGKERIYLFTGDISKEEILEINNAERIERLGVYFAKIIPKEPDKVRLSMEATQILGNQIKNHIFELTKSQAEDWMHGRDLNLQLGESKKGFWIMKHIEDFLGTGKASIKKIGNYIPKNRRLKPKN